MIEAGKLGAGSYETIVMPGPAGDDIWQWELREGLVGTRPSETIVMPGRQATIFGNENFGKGS